uniref:Autocrine motility factor receptor n=2 Tax=Plectus sambesii TaxID=2011161 RepID=A0A914W2U4_9BILA
AIMLLIRASYCTFRYAAYLYDLKNESAWEQRNSIIYYAEFAFEVSVAIIDLFHHIHMLVWGQIVLSMASLVMIMQIRYIYQKIDQRLRRHKNYKRITLHMDMHYPMAGAEDLALLEDPCAICWDRMEAARKLPCGHFFHNWCLRGWLEQDTSCPTCRMALAVGGQPVRDDHHVVPDAAGVDLDFTEQANSRRFNHFFHFDGRRYARWLPSFSVEVSHNLGASAFFQGRPPLTDSQLNTMAEQVREMFPQMPLSLIIEDLRETGASQATVENILEGRLMGEGGVSSADESGTEFDDESSDASDGHNLTNNMTSERPAASSVSAATSTRTRGASATLSDFFFRRSRTTTAASDGDAPSHLQQPSTSANPFALPSPEAAAVSLSTGVIVGGRFSKSSDEREIILNERKRALIDVHRRRYLASERGDDIRHLFPHENGQSMSSSGDAGDFSLPASSGLIRRAVPRPD